MQQSCTLYKTCTIIVITVCAVGISQKNCINSNKCLAHGSLKYMTSQIEPLAYFYFFAQSDGSLYITCLPHMQMQVNSKQLSKLSESCDG